MLAKRRQVIAVDLHGHGRTALGNRRSASSNGQRHRPGSQKLGYDKVDVLGYSIGAGVGFQFAIQHPGMVRRLALVSPSSSQDGFYPEMLPQQAAVGAAMADR